MTLFWNMRCKTWDFWETLYCPAIVPSLKWPQPSGGHRALNHVLERVKQERVRATSQNFHTAFSNAHRCLATQFGSRGKQRATDHGHGTGESREVGRPHLLASSQERCISRTGDAQGFTCV